MNLDKIFSEIDDKQAKLEPELENLKIKIQRFTNWAWFLVILGFIIMLFGVTCFIFPKILHALTLNELGDYFAGSVASVWSLAGLFFIYVAFLGQKQQLINQQIELLFSQGEVKATRFELEGQKEQLIIQNQTLTEQRFENTFFQLLSLHHQIVGDLDIRSNKSIINQGRDVFKYRYDQLFRNLRGIKSLEQINEIYIGNYKNWQLDFGHYFRNLYHIIKFIHFSNIKDKYKYTSFARAQLSSHELLMLFYNCLSENGNEKFKPLIEEYQLLKNMPINDLVESEHVNYYSKKAFKKK